MSENPSPYGCRIGNSRVKAHHAGLTESAVELLFRCGSQAVDPHGGLIVYDEWNPRRLGGYLCGRVAPPFGHPSELL